MKKWVVRIINSDGDEILREEFNKQPNWSTVGYIFGVNTDGKYIEIGAGLNILIIKEIEGGD